MLKHELVTSIKALQFGENVGGSFSHFNAGASRPFYEAVAVGLK